MTINQKLNKILEFIVANPKKNNMNPSFIHKILFEESISIEEAKALHRKIQDSGIVNVIGENGYIVYSLDTQIYLENGGFGGEYKIHQDEYKNSNQSAQDGTLEQSESVNEVFISYSWDTTEHENKVLAFTDHLRKKGFHAQLDKMLSQNETATDFIKMMHKAIFEHDKVIVVLSQGYKMKAETFTGGVGEEYQLLLNDIKKNPKKYILVSFEERSDKITPFGLQGREILDLSRQGGEEMLFRKLMDQNAYVFSPVAAVKPQLSSIRIDDFEPLKSSYPIGIEYPSIFRGDTSSQGGLYKMLEFKLILIFKNLSSISIDGFAYDLKVRQQLVPDNFNHPVNDGYITFSESLNQRIFPNQTVKSKAYDIKISSHAKHQIIGSILTLTVYTDQGEKVESFEVNELFKVSPPNHYTEPKQLMLDMFF